MEVDPILDGLPNDVDRILTSGVRARIPNGTVVRINAWRRGIVASCVDEGRIQTHLVAWELAPVPESHCIAPGRSSHSAAFLTRVEHHIVRIPEVSVGPRRANPNATVSCSIVE